MKPNNLTKRLSLIALCALTAVPAQAALIGYWPLDESSAAFTGVNNYTVADVSGNNQVATNAARASVTLGVAGQVGTGALIAGTTGAGRVLNLTNITSLTGAGRFTLSHWFKPIGNQAGANRGLVYSRSVPTSLGVNQIWCTEWILSGANRKAQIRFNNGPTSSVTYDIANSSTAWVHVALVYDGAARRIYVNGVETANSVVSGVVVSGTIPGFVFGGDSGFTDRHFNGTLDDIAMWNEALTPGQINNVYTNGLAGVGARQAFEANSGTLSTWNNSGGSTWSTGGNWTGGVPNSSTAAAKLGTSITAASTVNNDAAHSVNSVVFDSTNSYTIGGASTLTFAGDAPSINVQRGSHTVSANLATSGNPLRLNSAGTLVVGSQSYTDNTIISGVGVVSVSTLDNGGLPSGIGASSAADTSLTFDAGTLRYTGAGAMTDRSFRLGAGISTLDASGSGILEFTNSGAAIGIVASAGSETLHLTGTNTGNNKIALSLGNTVTPTVTPVSLVKSGSGRWVFGNPANAFTGTTLVTGGTLALSETNSLIASSTITVSNAVLDVSAVSGFSLATNQTLQGNGTVLGNLTTVTNNLRPGGSSAAGTLTINGNLTMNDGATYFAELSGLLAVPSDKIVVNGDLVLVGTNSVSISGLNPPVIQTGTYTLMEYTGTLTGDASNFEVINTSFYTMVINVDTINKRINLVVSGSAPLRIWSGDGILNQWNTTASLLNWASNGTPNTVPWLNGANALFSDAGNNAVAIAGSGTIQPSSVTVSNSLGFNYIINAGMSGSMSLVKLGEGDVTLGTVSTFTGGTVISNGTVKLNVDPNGVNTALGVAATSEFVFAVVKSGGTLDLNGRALGAQTANGKIIIEGDGVGGTAGALADSAGTGTAQALNRVLLTGNTLINNPSKQLGIRGDIVRNGYYLDLNGFTLTKKGAGLLYVSDVNITNGGTMVVAEGTLGSWANGVGSPGPNWGGSGSIAVSNGAAIRFGINNASGTDVSQPIQLAGTLGRIQAVNAQQVIFRSPITLISGYSFDFIDAETWTFRGAFSGATDFNKTGNSTFRLEGTNTYTGNTVISGGSLIIATNGSIASSPVIDVQTGASFNVSQKTGGFVLLLSQTLQGVGTVVGPISIQGTNAPGAGVSTAGTMTSQGGLSYSNGGTYDWELLALSTNTPGTEYDQIAITSGALTLGGTSKLKLNFVAGTPDTNNAFWQTPQSWVIIQGSGSASNPGLTKFATIENGSFPGHGFFRTQSAANGTVTLNYYVGDPATVPTTLNVTNNGTSLDFSWTGLFFLQSQTNTLGVGLTTNWYDYPGGATSPVNVPVVSTNPAVFYRLKSL